MIKSLTLSNRKYIFFLNICVDQLSYFVYINNQGQNSSINIITIHKALNMKDSKIQVVRNPSKIRRELYTFTMYASVSGIVMELDSFTSYKLDTESNEYNPVASYNRAESVAAGSGPRFAGTRSREQILERKSVPADVETEAKAQLLERITFRTA